jgi:hypothetical protein
MGVLHPYIKVQQVCSWSYEAFLAGDFEKTLSTNEKFTFDPAPYYD